LAAIAAFTSDLKIGSISRDLGAWFQDLLAYMYLELCMLKIADFSHLVQVPAKTLRYYDDIGLFHPAHVDAITGYRWYSVDQIPLLNRILALRDMGLALSQIIRVVQEPLSSEELHNMFRLQRAKILQEIEEHKQRLSRIEARLQQIEQEGRLPEYKIIVKSLESCWVVGNHAKAKDIDDIGPLTSSLFQHLFVSLPKYGCVPVGESMGIYDDEEFQSVDISLAMAVPVATKISNNKDIECWELPSVSHLACTIHRGPYTTLCQAHMALSRWIDANGYGITIPYREIYLHFSSDPSQLVTEIQYPLVINN
jgi:DNA-binding transcriptional MerR regulator